LQKIVRHINPGVFYALQPRNKHYELSNHLGNVLAVISDMKLYTCHEYNKFEDFENIPNINGDWNIRNSWEGQNAVLDLANGKLHVVENITSNPHVRINYLLPKHLPANQTYRIKFDLEHIIGDQNWQIGVASSNTDSTYESNFTFFSGGTGHNEITFRPTGPIWRIRFLHLPVAQNMEFYLDNFSIENLSLDSNTIAMADIVSATDYYPFGSPMPGRSFQSGGYRYGFNGKENDNEVKGSGNSYDFGARIYDSRLGRWLSLDPHAINYPNVSPHAAFVNNPILFVDHDGRDIGFSTITNKDGSKTVFITMNAKIVNQSSNKMHPSNMAALKSEIERTVRETFSKSFTGPDGKAVNVNFTLNLTEVSTTEQLKSSDHAIVLVDYIKIQTSGSKPIGLTHMNSNVVLVEGGASIEEIGRTTTHELAHDLGLLDEFKIENGEMTENNPDNLMGVGSSTTTTNAQRSTMFYRYAAVGNKIQTIWRNALNKAGDTKTEAKKFVKDEATPK